MKRIFVLTFSLCLLQLLSAQSKSELQQKIVTLVDEKTALQNEVNDLRTQILNLKEQILDLKIECQNCKSENDQLKNKAIATEPAIVVPGQSVTPQAQGLKSSTSTSPERCQAITAKGTQCTRNAEPNSKYCWQHKSTYEPSSTKQSVSSSSSSRSTSTGRTIYTGPRGGRYYINSKGNKVYIKK